MGEIVSFKLHISFIKMYLLKVIENIHFQISKNSLFFSFFVLFFYFFLLLFYEYLLCSYLFLFKLVWAKDLESLLSFLCGESLLCAFQLLKHFLYGDFLLYIIATI